MRRPLARDSCRIRSLGALSGLLLCCSYPTWDNPLRVFPGPLSLPSTDPSPPGRGEFMIAFAKRIPFPHWLCSRHRKSPSDFARIFLGILSKSRSYRSSTPHDYSELPTLPKKLLTNPSQGYIIISNLIESGGGNRPREARQPLKGAKSCGFYRKIRRSLSRCALRFRGVFLWRFICFAT